MKIRDFCSREVVTVEPLATLRVASILMRQNHVGALIVVEQRDGGSHPVGIVTDRDIVVGVVAIPGGIPEAIRVCDLMSTRLAVVREDDGVFEAVQAMSERGVRRLPVIAADGTLRGIVTADDIQRVVSTEMANLAAALKRGVEREELERRLDLVLTRS
ncbi:MAG TPA: CBS domain-containing protein [Burkholderiales bacterium]|nr:CBS domain-containing protein [Burkholderiales bacterium]